jgi:hypothetical protein
MVSRGNAKNSHYTLATTEYRQLGKVEKAVKLIVSGFSAVSGESGFNGMNRFRFNIVIPEYKIYSNFTCSADVAYFNSIISILFNHLCHVLSYVASSLPIA